MFSSKTTLFFLAILLPITGMNIAFAAGWPTERPIRLIVPTPPGGGADILARGLTEHLSRALKQTVIVENKSGANGMLANTELAKSAPDGYTALLTYTSAIAANFALQKKLPYDTLRDLKPVAEIGAAGTFLAVTTDVPADNLQSLIAWIKNNPAQLSYGSWGIGSGGHLTMEAVKKQAGIDISHVPYRGTAPVLADMASGVLKVAFVDTVAAIPYIKQGKIKALAVSGSRRVPLSPDIPTMAEQGYPFRINSWFAVFVPGHTSDMIVERLNSEINLILRMPEMKERLAQLNMSTGPHRTATEFGNAVKDDIKSYVDNIRMNNIRLD